jgi:pilus assembly protein CpaC
LFSLLFGAALLRGAAAQEVLPPPAGGGEPGPGQVSVLPVPVNTTKRVEMSNKAIIKEVRNENPKVARVQSIVDDPRAVLVTGLSVGVSRLTFIDADKKTEFLDIRVPDQSGIELEARRAKILEVLRATVPDAVVDPLVTDLNQVVLTGTAPSSDSIQLILETVRGVMGGPAARIYNGMRVGGVQQVQVEVVVALVNRSRLRQLSVNAGYFNNRWFLNSVVGTASGSSLQAAGTLTQLFTPQMVPNFGNTGALTSTLASSPNTTFGVLGHRTAFLGFIEALNTDGLAKVLAKPTVVTLSGRPGTITSGGQTPILTASGVGAASVSFKDFGTVVNFLPIVMSHGKIHLEVAAELSSINNANGITISGTIPTSVPGFSIRRVQDAVQMEDGQTLAIGGLIQNTINATINRVPVLGDIPFLNVLFSNKKYQEEEEELLILVTPRLVDPLCCTQIPQFLPGRETRSPDDFELFLEGIIEAPRGPRHVSLHPRRYEGAHMHSPNIGQYPCAGPGYLGLGCANGRCGVPADGPLGPGGPPTPPYPGLYGQGAATEAPVNGLDTPAPMPQPRNTVSSGLGAPTGRETENRAILPPVTNGGKE